MVSDFFYPNMGGVETHLYCLSQCLLARGHRVIIITHSYHRTRVGVRYLPNGLKVYYIPCAIIYMGSGLPTIFSLFPMLRNIWIRENTQLVHGHQVKSKPILSLSYAHIDTYTLSLSLFVSVASP